MRRSLNALPKSGAKRPWVVRQDFLADAIDFRFRDRVDEDMVFGRVSAPKQLVTYTRRRLADTVWGNCR